MIFYQTDKNIKNLQVIFTEKVTPSSGSSIEYMLNPCRASLTHAIVHRV